APYIGFNRWVKAVEKAQSTDVEKVLAALPGLEVPNLTGGTAKMLPNHHITKPVYIGEVRADGQFDVDWKTAGTVPGDAWSDFLSGSKDIEADWVTLKCGNYNTKTKVCSGQNYKRWCARPRSRSPSRRPPPRPGALSRQTPASWPRSDNCQTQRFLTRKRSLHA